MKWKREDGEEKVVLESGRRNGKETSKMKRGNVK